MSRHRRLFSRRLFLRRLTTSDASRLCTLITSNRDYLADWLPAIPSKISTTLAAEWIAEEHLALRRGERIDLGIFSLGEDRLIGRIALHSMKMGIQRSAGLSYWLEENSSKSGLMTEAVATTVSFAFEEARLHRIWADIVPENSPSLAICTKLGFRREGLCRKALFLNGYWQDTVQMSILEEEYDRLAESWIKKRFLGV